jgi:hypothetical protein
MSDRLSELVRQRALVLEHLAWIDREIAQANMAAPGVSRTPAVPFVTPVPLPAAPAAPDVSTVAVPVDDADEVLEQYRVSRKAVHQDVRKGCLLYFVGAFVVLGIVVAILYFTISSR